LHKTRLLALHLLSASFMISHYVSQKEMEKVKVSGTHQPLAYADGVNLDCHNINVAVVEA
jgi:hypothetical protein